MARGNYMAAMTKIAEASAVDAKAALLNTLALPDGGEAEVFHARVLVAGYVAPDRTKGGIILTDKSVGEERFQGSIGLVIGLGPLAFKDGAIAQFGGKELRLHDWVMYRASDGLELFINDVPCRLFEDVRIQMRVIDPTIYF